MSVGEMKFFLDVNDRRTRRKCDWRGELIRLNAARSCGVSKCSLRSYIILLAEALRLSSIKLSSIP